MRILVINPNTMPEMTDLVVRVIRPHLPPETKLVAATGRFGARYIASRSAAVIAAHAALDAFAEHGEGCDGVYLACFGDPGLLALRELASVPVVGMAQASSELAAGRAERFAIVTGGERWGPMLHEFLGTIGLSGRLAAVETVAPTGAEIARDPEGAVLMLAAACNRTVARDGAAAVVLGGAGLAGLAARVQPHVAVPVICSAKAGAERLLAALGQPSQKPVQGDFAHPAPVDSVGLSRALARRLSGL